MQVVPLSCAFFCNHLWTVHVHKQVLLEPHPNPATKRMNISALNCPYSDTTISAIPTDTWAQMRFVNLLVRMPFEILDCREGEGLALPKRETQSIWRCSFRSGTR